MKAHTTRMREATTPHGAARAFARHLRKWAQDNGHDDGVDVALCDDNSLLVTWHRGPARWALCLVNVYPLSTPPIPEALHDADDNSLCNDHWRAVPDGDDAVRFYRRPKF